MKIIEKLAEKGDPKAQFTLATFILKNTVDPKSYERAFLLAKNSASQGYSRAQLLVGNLFFRGVGTSQSFPDAISWYLQAADKGEPDSYFYIGLMYYAGLGVLKNPKMAEEWHNKYLASYPSRSLINFASVIKTAEGKALSFEEARKRYLKDAKEGDPVAQYSLGIMSLLGQGTPVDLAEAKDWFQKAANQGHLEAIYNLEFLTSTS
jgi:TPR repeat protein